MGFYLFDLANSKGYGFSKFVSSGNQASLDVSDYLEYLEQDEDTKVIVLYLEGVQEGKRFFEVAREVAKKKPIIAYKGGRSSAGSRATMSHTASLSGSDEVFNAACKQAGIIRCYEVFHPFGLAEALAYQPLPKGKRVAVLGSGGQCVAIADACVSLGLELPELDDDAKRELMEILPPHSPVPTNPVDTVASGIKMTIPRITEVLAKLDYIDGIITQGLWASFYTTPARIKQLASEVEIVTSIPEKYGKPMVCTQMAMRIPSGDLAMDLYRQAGIPAYSTPEESARAMWGLMRYGEIRHQLGV
jgi:acetyltransferase